MNKFYSKILFAAVLSMLLANMSITNAQAINEREMNDEEKPLWEEVFPQKQVESLVQEANKMTIADGSKGGPRGRAPFGSRPIRAGEILVTPDGLVGHAAIVLDAGSVVEANKGTGVQKGRNDWHYSKKQTYGVTVNRTSAAQDTRAANWCLRQIGKPYSMDFYNLGRRDAFYCSQLIYAAFFDNFLINLNTMHNDLIEPHFYGTIGSIHPMELVTTPETRLVYRKK